MNATWAPGDRFQLAALGDRYDGVTGKVRSLFAAAYGEEYVHVTHDDGTVTTWPVSRLERLADPSTGVVSTTLTPGTRVQAVLLDDERTELAGFGTVLPSMDWPVSFPGQWTEHNTIVVQWDDENGRKRYTPYSPAHAERVLLVIEAAPVAAEPDWDALVAAEAPECAACEDDPDASHADDCWWIAKQNARTEITLHLDGATLVRHTTDPDLSDLRDAGWTEAPLNPSGGVVTQPNPAPSDDTLPSLVRLDLAEAAGHLAATVDALLMLSADAGRDALGKAVAAARAALDEFEQVSR